MGNTCSSVHVALTGTTPEAIKGIVRAYTSLGFERAKTAPPEDGKHVILLRKEGDAFLSVYDSDNAALDTGELKDLALAASKIFKTAAVCTSLYDSDTFEVVVFNAGKQVDLVMTDPEQYSGPLKVLSDASRAAQWSKVFGQSLSVEGITQAITRNSAFADDALAGLSRLIGLTGGQSQLHYQDLLDDQPLTHHLHFTKQRSVLRAVPAGQIALRNYFDPDSSRMLLVNPASWPVALLDEVRLTWLILSEGAGFNDGTLAIHVSGPDGLAITRGYMAGSKFHNGQIVGSLETAPRDTTGASAEECSNRDSSRSRRIHRGPHCQERSPPDFRRWTFRRRHLTGPRRFSLFSSCSWWPHTLACGTSTCPCGRRQARTSGMICLEYGSPPLSRRGCLSFPVSTPRLVTRYVTLPRCNQGDR